MRTALRYIFVGTLILLALTAGSVPVRADLLLDVNYAPSVMGTGIKPGWSSSVVTDSEENRDYLLFPSTEALTESSGTIEMRLVRRNVRPIETLFTLVDENGQALLIAQLHWEGTFSKGMPELNFEGAMSDRLWSWNWSAPRFGSSQVIAATVPLGGVIQPGRELHLALTWGETPSDCAIHLNGRTLSVVVPEPFGMSSLVAKAANLVVGAEPASPMQGGFDHLNSPLNFLRTHDRPVNPFVPSIQGVTHNAFEIAGYSGKVSPGDLVTVTLEGDAYQEAAFDLGSRKNMAMEEDPDSPGRYTGTYLFGWGDGAFEESVTAYLTGPTGGRSETAVSDRPVAVDCRTHLEVATDNDLLPADGSSTSAVLIRAADINGKAAAGRPLKVFLSPTNEYTGVVGGGNITEETGVAIDVDWGGITDSFGEVTAEYVSGFAAKTMILSVRDMGTGDVGVGWVRSFIEGEVDIVVTTPRAAALSVTGTLDVGLSHQWLTADGQSRSRLTAAAKDAKGVPISGHHVSFTLLGNNGKIRMVQGKTDNRGRAFADYIAGTLMGQVQIEVRDQSSGLSTLVSIELRPDAPATIELVAVPGEVITGGESVISATVADANGNPNSNIDVIYEVVSGSGDLSEDTVPSNEDGVASVEFTAGDEPGLVKVRGTVTSRIPTDEELTAAQGAVFLFGLDEEPGRLVVLEWTAGAGDEVVKGQELVMLEDRSGNLYTVKAPRDGTVATFVAEERDRVEYGGTLGYILPLAE